MNWKTLPPHAGGSQDSSFHRWLVGTHGQEYARYYYENAGDEDFRHDRDPNSYPKHWTDRDQPLHPKDPNSMRRTRWI